MQSGLLFSVSIVLFNKKMIETDFKDLFWAGTAFMILPREIICALFMQCWNISVNKVSMDLVGSKTFTYLTHTSHNFSMVGRAYFKKARNACGMNKKGYTLVNLGQFKVDACTIPPPLRPPPHHTHTHTTTTNTTTHTDTYT